MASIDCENMYGSKFIYIKKGKQDRARTYKSLSICKRECMKWSDCEALNYNKKLATRNCIMYKVIISMLYIIHYYTKNVKNNV